VFIDEGLCTLPFVNSAIRARERRKLLSVLCAVVLWKSLKISIDREKDVEEDGSRAARGEQQVQSTLFSPITTTLIYLAVIVLIPFVMDFGVKFLLSQNTTSTLALFAKYTWIADVIGYTLVYLFMLFYLKTTFEPLRAYGYQWNSDLLLWSTYIGIASGVVMFLVDYNTGLANLGVQPFGFNVLFGYLLTWAVLPALVEETLFRGIIQTFYQHVTNTTLTRFRLHSAIFIAVAFEMLFHLAVPLYYGYSAGTASQAFMRTIPQLIYVFVFGAISGIVYQRTQSLVGPMLIHGLGNLTELLLIWAFM
jgi:membrane protease YdiL (CAAX protease family)